MTTVTPAVRRNEPADQPTLLERYSLAAMTSACFVALVSGWLLGRADIVSHRVELGFYVAAYLAGGARATWEALAALWARTIDINLLMVSAAIGAAIIGHWAEGGVLLFLFSLGGTLEHYAMGRTYTAIRALMDLRPEEALVLRDGVEAILPVEELRLDDTVIVRAGERIPADGEVSRGESAVDQSAITGESMPVRRATGDPVFAGTINGHGVLQLRVTRLASESTLAKIIAIVEEAQAQKSATQRFTDRFEGLYAGGVIAAAALFAIVPTLAGWRDASHAFYHAMILLVVASPCALVISTPASTLAALANAARNGILFKGAAHLEELGVARVVAFDKTGTLTEGRPRLTDVIPLAGVEETDLLALTATAERHSEHPLGDAVVQGAAARGIVPAEASGSVAVVGRGVSAVVDDVEVLVGNEQLFAERGIAVPPAALDVVARLRDDGKSIMLTAAAGRVLGVLAVADTVRPAAREVSAQLHQLGVQRTVILTGDNERAARAIARQAGIDDVRSGLLPEDKLRAIDALKREYGTVVMVGDGVNDAPALAAATIGIAMGAAGSDVALETADVVLMADDLGKLPYALALSCRTRRIIRQNLSLALGVIAVLVAGTVAGVTTLPLGVVGHEGSTIVVVMNGLRLLQGVPGWRQRGATVGPGPTRRTEGDLPDRARVPAASR